MPEINISQKQEKELITKAVFSSPFATIIASVLATFVIAAIFIKVGGPVPISVNQTTIEKATTLDVLGEGSTEVVPDQARITFGITIVSQELTDAQNQASEIIDKIKSGILELGVEEQYIKTSNFNIYPEYSSSEGKTRITGYRVTSQLTVAFKNFEVLNQAIDLASQNEANMVGGLALELSESQREKSETEARDKAIKKAKEKAKKIAESAGITLGKILAIDEKITRPDQPIVLESGSSRSTAQAEISPGTSKVTVQVTLSFETR